MEDETTVIAARKIHGTADSLDVGEKKGCNKGCILDGQIN